VRLFSPWIACALIALFAVPTLAAGSSDVKAPANGAFLVFDEGFRDVAGDPGDTDVTVAVGETVTWSYPAGNEAHNVVFDAGQMSGCQGLPNAPDTEGWQGSCTFSTPGTYGFFCQLHANMRGTVTVTGSGTPTPSASPSPSPTVTASPYPTATPPATPGFVGTEQSSTDPSPKWMNSQGATSDPTETITAGQSVSFAYPAGGQNHDVNFKAAPKPASCTLTKQSNAPDIYPAPPLPEFVSAAGWAGYCTFTAPGTYSFVCDAHPSMTGKVIVVAAATPTATATSTETAAPTATATPVVPAATNTPAPPAATPTAVPPPPRAAANPKLAATFTRKSRIVAFSGTITAKSGTVKLTLSFKNGKKTVKKTVSAKIAKGKFSAKLKLSPADAKKAKQLSVTLTYAGDAAFAPATKKATPKVKK
jgi:plastocyanin